MPQNIRSEDGTEIEVYTKEELEEQQQQAIEDYKTNNPEKDEELNYLQEELKQKDEELEKLKNKDQNFSHLRKQKAEAESTIEKIKQDVDKKIEMTKKEIVEGMMKSHYEDTLKSLSSGNDDLKKKIEFNYNRIQDTVSTKEDMSKKLMDAYLLSTKEEARFDNSIFSSSNTNKLNIKSDNKFSSEEKEFVQRLGQIGGMKFDEADFK